MRVYGLTGNIACGKSLVERMIAKAGVPVIDADQVARQVVEPGQPALAEIAAAWPTVIGPDGRLDRAALGAIVFAEPEARKRLEGMTHPRIFARMAELIAGFGAQGHELAVVSAPLMIESGSYRNYAGIVVVTCPEEVQLARLMSRDTFDEAAARARMESQMPQARKASFADFVIDNGGTIEETAAQVDEWLRRIGPEPDTVEAQ